jgi:riboflavin kinase/FMN adenylyltransferase
VVVTFDRHPSAIVAPDRVPQNIFTRSQKLREVQALGADVFLEIPFDQAFSQKVGEIFIRELARDFGKIQSICVGANFVFGCKRSGNVALLQTLGVELNFRVHGHAAVALDGEVVSSTRIREAIRTGNLDAASQMLGRPYAICGPVIEGDKIGRQLGFPTANLTVTNLALPPHGVYAGWASHGGQNYRVALNIGVRPTVASALPQLRVEAHLLDFAGELYETELEVQIGRKLREERRFASVEELRQQITQDVQSVRQAG